MDLSGIFDSLTGGKDKDKEEEGGISLISALPAISYAINMAIRIVSLIASALGINIKELPDNAE